MRLPSYFIATDGKITIWRASRRDRFYRSATIKEFSRGWRSSRPSGPDSHPAVQIKQDMFNDLLVAAEKRNQRQAGWLANRFVPPAILSALGVAAADALVDQIAKEAEL